MGKKNKGVFSAAVIDIGTNALRLIITELKHNKLCVIEDLRYPLSLGRDTFNTGKISFDKADKACDIIKNFLSVISEYGVSSVKAVATTALREAANKEYILDQIKNRTGLTVLVLDDWEEKNYIYKQMDRMIIKSAAFKNAGLMVYIGSGSLGVSVYDNGAVPFTQSIRIGSLRLTEILEDIQDSTDQFYTVLEEYIKSFTDSLSFILPRISMDYFFASGREISLIANICNAEHDDGFLFINNKKFFKLYDYIKNMTVNQIMQEYELPEDKAEVLLPAMSLFKVLNEFTKADKIVIPLIFLRDALLFEMLYPQEAAELDVAYAENTLLSAKTLAARFKFEEEHAKRVSLFALKIFDRMKKIHGLGQRERLLLEAAAILHDIGKFINIKNHYMHSYEIISGFDIVGLNLREIEIVALVAKFHSRITPADPSAFQNPVSRKDKVIISKLSAILRIADALDRSHLQKFDNIEVKIAGKELLVCITTFKNTQIEEWSFKEKGIFFEEVYGIKAIIKKKKVM